MAEDNNKNILHPGGNNLRAPSFVGGPWKFVVEESDRYRQQHISNDDKSARPKETWPEVVGLTIEEAANIVKQEKPGAEIEIVYPFHAFILNLDLRRVILCVDFSGKKVQDTPCVG